MSAIDGVARQAASSQRGGLQFCFISMSLGAKAPWQQHKMLLVSCKFLFGTYMVMV